MPILTFPRRILVNERMVSRFSGCWVVLQSAPLLMNRVDVILNNIIPSSLKQKFNHERCWSRCYHTLWLIRNLNGIDNIWGHLISERTNLCEISHQYFMESFGRHVKYLYFYLYRKVYMICAKIYRWRVQLTYAISGMVFFMYNISCLLRVRLVS